MYLRNSRSDHGYIILNLRKKVKLVMLSKGIQIIINAKCSSIRHQANSITVGTHYIERLQIQ